MRLVGELGRNVDAGAAGAVAFGIAALGHETADHPVKGEAVVEALAHQFLDPGDVLRRQVGAHLDDHLTVLQIQQKGVFRVRRLGLIGHRKSAEENRQQKNCQSGHRGSLPLVERLVDLILGNAFAFKGQPMQQFLVLGLFFVGLDLDLVDFVLAPDLDQGIHPVFHIGH